MSEKGLGAGLGALFGKAAIEDDAMASAFLPISKIEPRSGQPRSRFDEERLAELAESIREHGVIQPLTVRRLESGYYQIIAGERRWRAARMAGLFEVPARVIEADDKRATVLAMVENLQREDLNPAEEARGYRTLMKDYGMTQEQVAEVVGKSRPVITNALRLLTLPDKVLDMLEKGILSQSQGRALLELNDEEDRLKAALAVTERGMTVREATKFIKQMKTAPKKKTGKKNSEEVDYVAEVEKRLSNALGRGVRIAYGRKKGRIELEYYGDDDFEMLCAALEILERRS